MASSLQPPVTQSAATAFGARLAQPAKVRLPISLKLIVLSLFLPEAMSFYLGSLRLTCTRLLFIMLVPAVSSQIQTKVASGQYRFVASDLFVSAATLWIFIGPAVTYGFLDTFVHSGPIVLEFLMAYLTSRFLLTSNREAEALVDLLCLVIVFVV